MALKSLSIISLASLIAYSLFIYLLTFIFNYSLGTEFFIAIFFIIAYFLFVFAFLLLSLNLPSKFFFKIYFLGSIIRLVGSLLFFLVIIKLTELNALKILIFTVPIYFIFLIIESLWVNKNASRMENTKNAFNGKNS